MRQVKFRDYPVKEYALSSVEAVGNRKIDDIVQSLRKRRAVH